MKNLPEIFRSFLALSSQNNLRLMKARKGQNCLRLFHRMTSRRLASVISYNRLPNSDQQSVTYNDQLVRIKTPFDRIDNTDHISSTSSVLIDTICPKLYRPKCRFEMAILSKKLLNPHVFLRLVHQNKTLYQDGL